MKLICPHCGPLETADDLADVLQLGEATLSWSVQEIDGDTLILHSGYDDGDCETSNDRLFHVTCGSIIPWPANIEVEYA